MSLTESQNELFDRPVRRVDMRPTERGKSLDDRPSSAMRRMRNLPLERAMRHSNANQGGVVFVFEDPPIRGRGVSAERWRMACLRN